MSKTIIGTMISVAVVAGLVGGTLSTWLILRWHKPIPKMSSASPQAEEPAQSISAQEFQVVDKDGKPVATLSSLDGQPDLYLIGKEGLIDLLITKDGGPQIRLVGGNNEGEISLSVDPEGENYSSRLYLGETVGDSGGITLLASRTFGSSLELARVLNKHREVHSLPASLNLSVSGEGDVDMALYPEVELKDQKDVPLDAPFKFRVILAEKNRRPLLRFGFADNEKPYMGIFDKKGKVKWAVP
jgi:hypothetical protein